MHAANSVSARALLLGFLLFPRTGLCADTAQQLAQRVDKYYNGLHSLRTAFTESFHGMGIDREESGTLLDVVPGNEMASDRKTVNKELHERMQVAIAGLSEDQKEVFLMREFLDMPFKQIADVVGVPEEHGALRT